MSRALGRYELLRPLARGGMGEVYLARRRAAGVEKWLVVKRMRPERAGDARFLELFMREARLSMSLAHQNIVPVFDFGRIDDQVFLAMERVEGKDLGSSLHKTGTGLPPLLAGFIAAECLQALDYAHRRKSPDGVELGIVHRDVTPRNVLLSWAGEVKLTDFGIASLASDTASKTAGTPAYMAPEQARGEPLDPRADIYAVGLVLREALTGQRARKGNDRQTALELAQKGVLDPWPSEVEATLRGIADRATSADKAERYADARTMLEEIDRYIVAERAAHKGDAPARQLADWLAEVWKDAREDEIIDSKIEAGELLSFLDDGPLDIIGTGTQRSGLATAAEEAGEEAPPVRADTEPTAPRADTEPTAPRADTAPTRAPTPDAKAGDAFEPASSRAATEIVRPPPRRRAWLVIPVLALAALSVYLLTRSNERSSAASLDASVAITTPTADAAVTMAAPDAGELLVDAAVVIAHAPHDAGAKPVQIKARTQPDAAVELTPPPAAATRKVTINSKPTWSNWTVDGGPQHSGVETIELTPGKHTIHFTGNPYFKTDKTVTIDVPDRDGFTHVETLEQLP